jgi:acetyl esterase/lipase
MVPCRDHYLPKTEDRVSWGAKIGELSDHLVSNVPRACIAVAEMAFLRDEGIAYGGKLRRAGVEVTVKVHEKASLSILLLDGMHSHLGHT